MANSNLTEMLFILDRSGSMSGLEADTVGGFNSMIAQWKARNVPVIVNTMLFDHEILFLHDRISIENVQPMTKNEYWARGNTALYDAVGTGIKHLKKIHKYIRPEDVPGHVTVVITTDGYENASTAYTAQMVHDLISEQKKQGWKFIFLGADIDAEIVAQTLDIDRDMAFSINKSAESARDSFVCVGAVCTAPGGFDRGALRQQLKKHLRKSGAKKGGADAQLPKPE